MVAQLAKRYATSSEWSRLFGDALYAFVIFYGGAWLQVYIGDLLDAKKIQVATGVIMAIFIFICFMLFMGGARLVRKVITQEKQREEIKRRYLSYASSLLDNLVSDQIQHVREPINDDGAEAGPAIFSCMPCIKGIVHRLYHFFEAHYGESEKLDERIDFEVTFMTRSYKDEKITIPAYANRQGRSPVSMLQRDKQPGIYDNTITAEVYEEVRPDMRIVEDTADPKSIYHELYTGQRERIRSSIIYPILDDKNSLLGTLVVHCNRSGFFKYNEGAFWRELLEMYARRLALEKSRLDLLMSPAAASELRGRYEAPF